MNTHISSKAQRETAGCRSSWKGNQISDAKSPVRPSMQKNAKEQGEHPISKFVPTFQTCMANSKSYTKMELNIT